jgi:Berberine and berberine like
MKSVKAKYDPKNLFRVNQNILPAALDGLPRAGEAVPDVIALHRRHNELPNIADQLLRCSGTEGD